MSAIHVPRKPTLDVRALLFPAVLLFGLLAIFLRLWYIQVVKAPELEEKAALFRNTSLVKLAPRGLILDRNGETIAGVRSRFVVTGVPSMIKKSPWVIDKIAKMLGVDQAALWAKLEDASWRPNLPAPIYVGASVEVATRIAEGANDLPGIGIESQPMRAYPDPKTFSLVLGYVGAPNAEDSKRLQRSHLKPSAYVGKMGLEAFYEEQLSGTPGADRLEIDAKRRPVRIVGRDNPVPGSRLILGLDASLQRLAAEELGGKVGAAVAIDPNNGEILCLASSPGFDASKFENGISTADWKALNDDPDKPLYNRATGAAFAPGSTFKLVTSLAALRVGKFDPDRAIYCPGYFQIGKRKLKCLGHHGLIRYHDALVKSCNTYFATLAVDVGEEALRRAALDCGFYAKSGIDLPTERRGVIPTDAWIRKHRKPARWYKGDTANMGIGQGEVATTPLQMANLVALVAMEGTQYHPHLVKAVRSPDGALRPVTPEVENRVEADGAFWSVLKNAMTDVIQSGTAAKAKIPGLDWAGKTGSAEVKGQAKTNSWFVGYAPADHPQIAICVMIVSSGHGGDVAAPAAGNLVKHYLVDEPAARKAAAKSAPAPSALATPAASPELR